ncbi:ORF_5 [Adoxophyes orana granulovirus]|uniref:ADOR5 n=1 Tax=Adoxophyes orana granulovirus TaxID=170617 RepID=Q91B70_GVAO|nr:ORF_5 [Adoxophyes orana granulovirus]AAL02086.1 unknown [Adoxophyes orana granulovirus]AAP85642.1 ORF_5 [Adoxophyes orana granulovirus]AJA91645.1 ADOR5 [Adoxophyes orana granulovirus]
MDKNILNWQESSEWNRLQDIRIYIKNNMDIGDCGQQMIDVLIGGMCSMMTKENKTEILTSIKNLLENTKLEYEKHLKEDNYTN